MKSLLVVIATFMSLHAQARNDDQVLAVSFSPTIVSYVMTLTSTSNMQCGRDYCGDKLIVAAKDDAAAFVGSEGKVRGVQLNTALEFIRQGLPALQASDMELAQAILVF